MRNNTLLDDFRRLKGNEVLVRKSSINCLNVFTKGFLCRKKSRSKTRHCKVADEIGVVRATVRTNI